MAYINKDNQNFYIGSNGKLIKTKNQTEELPYIYGDLNPVLRFGDPIGDLNLTANDPKFIEKLMGFLLDSQLQTHNIGSNLRMSAKYYSVSAPKEASGRPAKNYSVWDGNARPAYYLEIDLEDVGLLSPYSENRIRLKEIVDNSMVVKNYDYKERKATNYPAVQKNLGLPLEFMIISGARRIAEAEASLRAVNEIAEAPNMNPPFA